MSPLQLARLVMPACLAGVALAPAIAGTSGNPHGVIDFQTKVGSFKMLGNQGTPAEGKLQISFTGTVLVDQVSTADPKITITGGQVRKEYENAKRLQVAYHGTGTMVIDGRYTSIQWFGRDMKASWDGWGHLRLVGEFDKDLKTGTYYYGANPNDIHEWGSSMHEITNPGVPGKDFQVVPQARPGG